MVSNVSIGLRLKQIIAYVNRSAKRYLGFNKTVYVDQRAAEYRGYWEKAAKDLSADFIVLRDDFWEIRDNGHRVRIANDIVPINDPIVFYITSDKGLCFASPILPS